ncbi:MlaD family protein [Cupriavidus sp. AU9028]|nr:MlaD family protein [Cupriavidus sp. AU9028]
MENKSNAFLAGVFTIGLAVLVLFALFWFGTDHTEREPYDLVTRSTVTGLGPQADVKYRGLTVGRVETIRFDPTLPGQIIVRIMVDKDAPITRTTYATLGFQGVTGIAYIQLDDTAAQDGSNAASPPLETSPKAVARIAMRPGFFEELERRGDSLLSQVESLMVSLNETFQGDNRRELIATVRAMHEALDAYTRVAEGIEPAARQLPQITANLNKTLASVERLTHELARPNGALLGTVDEVGAQLRDTAVSLRQTTERLNNETLPQIDGLTRDARQTVRSFDRAAGQFSDNPRSVLFGGSATPPGPGEAGFAAPAPAR